MTKTIRILHFTSYDEDCGIAKYQEQFIQGMAKQEDIYNEVFPYSPYLIKKMTLTEKSTVAKQLSQQMNNFDILHIQHEFGFYDGDELVQIIDLVHKKRKKIIVTMHTSPTYAYKPVVRGGIGPRSVVNYAREKRAYQEFMRTRFEPIKKVDLIIVHNAATQIDLIKHGIDKKRTIIVRHPVRAVKSDMVSTEIADNLHRQTKDVIFATVGFPSSRKGAFDAVKALAYLPDNYKLAVIGGVHPSGENEKLINKICDLALELKVADRMYITGFVKDDERMNALIRESDVCIYPYVKAYYDHVSSGALNHAIGNHMPVIAYPTESFVEMNSTVPVVQLTKSFNYYELARSIKDVDYKAARKYSSEYAGMYNWPEEAAEFAKVYRLVAAA